MCSDDTVVAQVLLLISMKYHITKSLFFFSFSFLYGTNRSRNPTVLRFFFHRKFIFWENFHCILTIVFLICCSKIVLLFNSLSSFIRRLVWEGRGEEGRQKRNLHLTCFPLNFLRLSSVFWPSLHPLKTCFLQEIWPLKWMQSKKNFQNFTLLYGSRHDSLNFIINFHHLLWDFTLPNSEIGLNFLLA